MLFHGIKKGHFFACLEVLIQFVSGLQYGVNNVTFYRLENDSEAGVSHEPNVFDFVRN